MRVFLSAFLCLLLLACTATIPQIDVNNWAAVNTIQPEFGNSPELAKKFSHWPNYKGAYDIKGGAKTALRWCKYEASLNYEYRQGTLAPDAKRTYGFIYSPTAPGAPRKKPSDPQWVKDCTECMEALGYEYTGPDEI